MAKNKFPQVLYVTQDQDGDETFELAHRTIALISEDEDGAEVAVYELKKVSRLLVNKDLVN